MDTLLKCLETQRLKAAPGEFSVYCNDGFSLAQLLVEKVSGVSFSEYMKKNISEPLTMGNTATPLDEFNREQLAKTYTTGSTTTLPIDNVNAIGAGGIYSTAEDLCRFAEMFMYGSTDKVLSDTSSKAMAESEYLKGIWGPDEDASFNYGLGWDSVNLYPFTQYGIKALTKGGDTTLYHCNLVVLPEEGMAMAVLTSGGASTYGGAFAQEVLLKALLAKGSITEIKANKTFTAPVKATMPSSVKKNAGYYALFAGVVNIAISDDGILSLYNGAAQPQQFIYTGDGKFYYADGSTYVSFEEESNGNTYFYVHSYTSLPYLGQTASSGYQAQKITDNKLSAKVKAAWEKRAGKVYMLLNEKYSSQAYSLSSPVTQVVLTEGIEGYYQSAQIIDANNAKTLIQIPCMFGRDLFDFKFYTKGKTEYLKAGNAIYAIEDAVKTLSTKTTVNVKIGTEGYAQWYKISAKSEGKNIKITLPKKASVAVYDENGTCTYSSMIADNTTTTLPEGAYIVFVGDAGAKFTVKYLK
jgi:CubicO group peptidase (beta-lactamase class C family)